MSEDGPVDPLQRFSERLAQAQRGRQSQQSGAGGSANTQQGIALGLRIGIDFVVAVGAGAGLGWAFDRVLGTQPWGTLVLFFLGVAAGMLNVYRAVARIGGAVGLGQRRAAEQGAASETARRWDEDEN